MTFCPLLTGAGMSKHTHTHTHTHTQAQAVTQDLVKVYLPNTKVTDKGGKSKKNTAMQTIVGVCDKKSEQQAPIGILLQILQPLAMPQIQLWLSNPATWPIQYELATPSY